MCRDYNTRNTECAIALTRLYLSFGMAEQAYKEVFKILRTERLDRLMVNNFREWDCDVPTLALEVVGSYLVLHPHLASLDDAKYLIMMVRF